jgi:hypothetical protein
MHQWRKRVKDLRYAAEMLDHRSAGSSSRASASSSSRASASRGSSKRSRAGKRASDSSRRLRRLAGRADELGELLGEEHDLAIFAVRLRARGQREDQQTWRTGRRTREQLLKIIAKRRRVRRKRALRRGKRLYRERPSRFMRRVRSAHASGAQQPS